ncbi:hypothetical protein ACUWEX_12180 [Okibacterium fritillariae]|uniref:Uncharacterized protein n=1 Tax=Okibacterium fritillariae TaxID=123320 RepID=A0A1T5K5W9_9MICO|nr:hypothetical protein [Okibacterium fritillariae]SKC59023.1 hypothetical protein SAMN06309945_1926 [Okibacterium fritillariae]
MTRGVAIAYAVGSFFALLTVGLFLWTTTAWWNEGSVYDLPGGRFWNQNSVIGLEFLFLVLGMAAILMAEFSRQGITTESGGPLGLGTNRVDVTRRRYFSRVAWMLVPLLSWAAIVFVPLWASATGDPYETPEYGSPESMWVVIAANAIIAAGAFGVMVASFVKAVFYDRAARLGRLERSKKGKRKGLTAKPARGEGFFALVSYQGRLELVLAFLAVGTLGLLPFAFADEEGVASYVPAVMIGAVVTLVIALVIAANSWRSGRALTAGESLVGGIAPASH